MSLRSVASRMAIALVAVVAITSMHAGSASAHACHVAGAGAGVSASAEDHASMAGAAYAGHHHGDHQLSEARSEHRGTPHDDTAGASHCATPACGAIVLSAPRSHETTLKLASIVGTTPDDPPPGAAAAPDPPVPRPLLHP